MMKNIDYENDSRFILHQPFFQDGVQDYNELMYSKPYQALFYEFRTGKEDTTDSVTYIPNGCMDILFILDSDGSHMEILGSSTQAKQIRRLSEASYFGIRLKPGLCISYQGLTLKDITDHELLFEHIREGFLTDFFCYLKETDELEQKIDLFHSYFDSYINAGEVNDLTGYILSEINFSQGNVKIHELADELHYSERHISRIFQDTMGLTPKTFARIVRFQNVVDSILHQPIHSLCDYMSELGYSDQAHFQREFKQYTGITPKRFLIYAQSNPYSLSDMGINTVKQKQAS